MLYGFKVLLLSFGMTLAIYIFRHYSRLFTLKVNNQTYLRLYLFCALPLQIESMSVTFYVKMSSRESSKLFTMEKVR